MRATWTSGLLIAAGLMLPAHALGQEMCSHSFLSACATIERIRVSGNTLTLTIRNSSNLSNPDVYETSHFGALLLRFRNEAPSATSILVKVDGDPDARGWKVKKNVGSILGGEWDAAFQSFGEGSGVYTGETATITIVFDGTIQGNDLVYAGVKMQGIGSANSSCPEGDGQCGDWAYAPEPVTMVLLATGLAGLGGARALRRRRRGFDIETE